MCDELARELRGSLDYLPTQQVQHTAHSVPPWQSAQRGASRNSVIA
jgi:hypothetical protein